MRFYMLPGRMDMTDAWHGAPSRCEARRVREMWGLFWRMVKLRVAACHHFVVSLGSIFHYERVS